MVHWIGSQEINKMKTTIDYSDKTEREAISDVLFYIGFNHFKKVVREISKYTDNEETRKSFMIGLEFAGVQGYPAKAMLNRYLKGEIK
jgi:hypothetical protein